MSIPPDNGLFDSLREVLLTKTHAWSGIPGIGGTGAPGMLLEHLLGIEKSSSDSPDSMQWELKFHGGSAPLTLFHKTPEPSGIMHEMVNAFGWRDANDRISFRHTIYGSSSHGFRVINDGKRIVVQNVDYGELIQPYWSHDTLINAFAYKLRRLVLVKGKTSRKNESVSYESVKLYWEPSVTQLIDAIESGIVAIDFDARTTEGKGLRDHGTKFRIQITKLDQLYQYSEPLN